MLLIRWCDWPRSWCICDRRYNIHGGKAGVRGHISAFSPGAYFAALSEGPNPSKFKQFKAFRVAGRGAVQIMYSVDESKRRPILAAMSQHLQFEWCSFTAYKVSMALILCWIYCLLMALGDYNLAEKQCGGAFVNTAVKTTGTTSVLFNEWNCQ